MRDAPLTRCLGELQESARSLFAGRPEWTALRDGARHHARLAVLRVFLSQTPLSGDRCTGPVICREPGSSTFPLGTWVLQCSVRLPHLTATTVPDDCVGGTDAAPPGRMPTLREVAIQGSCDRDDTGSGM